MSHTFLLDSKLAATSELVIEYSFADIRISNNALVPWLLIIPKTDKTEWFELSDKLQQKLNNLINHLSSYLKEIEKVDKINFAIIGNVVSQMHIHLVGRFKNDFCWPDVIWGKTDYLEYKTSDKKRRMMNIIHYLELI